MVYLINGHFHGNVLNCCHFFLGKLKPQVLHFFLRILKNIHRPSKITDRMIKNHIHAVFLRLASIPPAAAEPANRAGRNKQGIHAIY